MGSDLSDLSDQELQLLRDQLNQDLVALREKVRAVAREAETREEKAAAKRRWDALNDKERAALLQVIEAKGIETAEVVVGPGGVRSDG